MLPLVFEPYLRPQVWGQRRLKDLGKPLPPEGNFGESWEISGHPHHISRVAEGPWRGVLLTELCGRHGEDIFGSQKFADGRFPLLIKFLDCHDLLSIQVHPTDDLAARLTKGERGKTEAWVILDVAPGGRIYAGLNPGTTPGELERRLADGTVQQCLHAIQPRKGDCIFLPAGTVHAVGGGVVMAEVQQSSDATFRLYDWNRPGPDGKPRPLHIPEALAAIDWDRGPVQPVIGSSIADLPSRVLGEVLVGCPYFVVERYQAAAPFSMPYPGRLSIWMVLDGTARLASSVYQRDFCRAETVLIPASAPALRWQPAGACTLLGVRLP
jgi:mannose-6-phosphate isomerase